MRVPGTRLLAIKKLTDTMGHEMHPHKEVYVDVRSVARTGPEVARTHWATPDQVAVGTVMILEHSNTGGSSILALHVVRIRRAVLALVVITTHASHVGSGCRRERTTSAKAV